MREWGMSESGPVRLAILGCGGMAGAHSKGLEALWKAARRAFEVVATCDVDRDRAESMASAVAAFQGKRPAVWNGVGEMLAGSPEIEAVDVVTVHREHHALAIACLEAGKHVIIEKPLAITLRAGKAILAAAEQAGRLLAVAENYRRAPDQRAIRWALREGRIGQPRMLFWIDVGERLWYWNWREHKKMAGGGWSLDGGVHFADLFRFYLGDVTRVSALSRALSPVRYRDEKSLSDPIPVDVEDTTLAWLEFASGAVGQWTSTSAAPGQGFGRRVLYGDRGSLDLREGLKTREETRSVAELTEEYQATLTAAERERLFPGGVTDTVATELHEFFLAVRGQGHPETDGLEGYKAEAISFALYESEATGRPVTLPEIESLAVEAYQSEINRELGLS
jgi:predicted dehydrogenase